MLKQILDNYPGQVLVLDSPGNEIIRALVATELASEMGGTLSPSPALLWEKSIDHKFGEYFALKDFQEDLFRCAVSFCKKEVEAIEKLTDSDKDHIQRLLLCGNIIRITHFTLDRVFIPHNGDAQQKLQLCDIYIPTLLSAISVSCSLFLEGKSTVNPIDKYHAYFRHAKALYEHNYQTIIPDTDQKEKQKNIFEGKIIQTEKNLLCVQKNLFESAAENYIKNIEIKNETLEKSRAQQVQAAKKIGAQQSEIKTLNETLKTERKKNDQLLNASKETVKNQASQINQSKKEYEKLEKDYKSQTKGHAKIQSASDALKKQLEEQEKNHDKTINEHKKIINDLKSTIKNTTKKHLDALEEKITFAHDLEKKAQLLTIQNQILEAKLKNKDVLYQEQAKNTFWMPEKQPFSTDEQFEVALSTIIEKLNQQEAQFCTQVFFTLPDAIAAFAWSLTEEGRHKVYLVGGCVRDAQLNTPITDFDLITTNPSIRACAYSIPAFPSLHKLTIKEQDTDYPVDVMLATDLCLETDAMRRDFTINSLHARLVFDQNSNRLIAQVIDTQNALNDFGKHALIVPGDIRERLKRDPSLILRLIRFTLQFRAKISPYYMRALADFSPLLPNIPLAVLKTNLEKCFKPGIAYAAFQFLYNYHLLPILFPALTHYMHNKNGHLPIFTFWDACFKQLDKQGAMDHININEGYAIYALFLLCPYVQLITMQKYTHEQALKEISELQLMSFKGDVCEYDKTLFLNALNHAMLPLYQAYQNFVLGHRQVPASTPAPILFQNQTAMTRKALSGCDGEKSEEPPLTRPKGPPSPVER